MAAQRLDDLEQAFRVGVNDVTERAGWKGKAAETADQDLERVVRQIAISASQVKTVSSAASQAAADLPGVQAALRSAIAEAESMGIRVADEASGYRLTANPAKGAEVLSPEDSARLQSAIDGFVTRINGILQSANEVDSKIAGVMTTLMPRDVAATEENAWQNAVDDSRRIAGLYGVGPVPEKMNPSQAAGWWNGLSEPQRRQYLDAYPHEIGSTDGLPAAARNEANRSALDLRLAEMAISMSTDNPKGDRSEWENLNKIRDTLNRNAHDQNPRDLYLLKFDDKFKDGSVVMSIGDPDKAKNTAVYVPGTNSTVQELDGAMDRAGKMYEASDSLAPGGGNVATVFWLDYDAPELSAADAASGNLSVAGWGRSEEGAPRLDSFIDGLRAQNGSNHLTLVGHSYGTAVIGDAARQGDGLAVDDMILVGSPGVHADRAEDLNIDPRHVWAQAAEGDKIPAGGAAGHAGDSRAEAAKNAGLNAGGDALEWGIEQVTGSDAGVGSPRSLPSDEIFGGNRLTADPGGHSSYWDMNGDMPGNSLENQARVIMGRYNDPDIDNRPILDFGAMPGQGNG